MGTISKPNTFTANTTIASSQVNANFDTIYNEFNGGISSANLADDAVTTDKIADGAVTTDKLASGIVDSGWAITGGTHTVSNGYNAGNRSFTIDTSTDISGVVSEGMRYRVERGTTPTTQCADLESSSSQYASVTPSGGTITFTDDFTCEAWVKLESYTDGVPISRRNTTNGWEMRISNTGQVETYSLSGGASNYRGSRSYQSIPLDKWVHVAATVDLSTSTYTIYIDGVSVPLTEVTSGTAPTSLTQAGDLAVGFFTGHSGYFDGKLADVRVWSDIRDPDEIRDNMYGYPSMPDASLVAHFKGDGDWTDSSANGNDLTASGSAGFTTDNPWNATEYGIITNVTASTIQVFCPVGYGIPNETLSNPYYSTQSAPFGFPRSRDKWLVETHSKDDTSTGTNATWVNIGSFRLSVPIGSWEIDCNAGVVASRTATGMAINGVISTSATVWDEDYATTFTAALDGGASGPLQANLLPLVPISKELSSQTTLYMLVNGTFTTATMNTTINGASETSTHLFRATCAYL